MRLSITAGGTRRPGVRPSRPRGALRFVIAGPSTGSRYRAIVARNEGARRMLSLSVNGQTHELDIEPETPMLWVLRD